MSDRTNDEKLRILQERLAQIKQKQDTPIHPINEREYDVKIAIPENEVQKSKGIYLNSSLIKKVIIIVSLAFGIFYGYTNIDFRSLVQRFSSQETSQESKFTQLKYNFNLEGKNIAIVSTPITITDEGTAKAMVSDLTLKGFKCDYIYLPENSNLKDKVYQVFIGPYENEEETNQWAKNLELEFNIITL